MDKLELDFMSTGAFNVDIVSPVVEWAKKFGIEVLMEDLTSQIEAQKDHADKMKMDWENVDGIRNIFVIILGTHKNKVTKKILPMVFESLKDTAVETLLFIKKEDGNKKLIKMFKEAWPECIHDDTLWFLDPGAEKDKEIPYLIQKSIALMYEEEICDAADKYAILSPPTRSTPDTP